MNTSVIQRLRWAGLGAFLLWSVLGGRGQGLQLSVQPSANVILVAQPLTYTINLTNRTGFTLGNVWVTNAFSAPVSVGPVSFTLGNGIDYAGSAFTNSSTVILDFARFLPSGLSSGVAQATVTISPQADGTNGFLTNAVVAVAPEFQPLNPVLTNVLVQVTNASVQADLAVSISGLRPGILAGDTVRYTVTVTNLGPDTVPNVYLTNTLPGGTALLGVSPTNQISSVTNNLLILNLGTLTNRTAASVRLTVQPTNAGPQTFSASVGASNFTDLRPTNNNSSVTVDIGTPITGQIIATNASAMALDPQTGLMNQTVRLVNVSTSSIPSVRLTVSGLTNWLYNSVGTNGGSPFVIYGSSLDSSQSVDLVLEYFVPTRRSITVDNTNYTAVGIPAFIPTPPASTNAPFQVTRTLLLTDGSLLIEFPSLPGASYSILYSPDATFTNSQLAQPSIVAPADRVQWIDDGPPKTVSRPASVSSRFYRVIKN